MSKSFDIICGVIKHRITEQNKSFMLLIVGEMGSGKSLAGVSIACRVDPSFSKKPRIVYTVREFLDALLVMNKGEVIIFDEAGVGIPAREWQQQQNKIMSIITQILRFKNICVIFTTPNIRLLDINVRETMNGFLKPRYILKNENINVCTYKVITVNDAGESVKKNFVHYDGKSGAAGEIIDPLYVPRPDPVVEKYYEEMSLNMKNEKLRELQKELTEGPATPNNRTTTNQAKVCINLIQNLRTCDVPWSSIANMAGVSARLLQTWTEHIRQSDAANES